MISLPNNLTKYNIGLSRYTNHWRYILGQLVYKLYTYGETYETIGKLLGQTGRSIRKHYPKTKENKYV